MSSVENNKGNKLLKLLDLKGIPFKSGVLMSEHTSFKIGGPAFAFVEPTGAEQAGGALAVALEAGFPVVVMGNGSNMLVSDAGINALVICIGPKMGGILHDGQRVRAGAGCLLNTLSKTTVESGFSGLEWAVGIPGTVGGAVAMNAGAYGGEIKQVLARVVYLDSNGLHSAVPEDADLGYRTSAFCAPDRVVVEAEFKLGSEPGAKERMLGFMEERKRKQPLQFPSAGSVFKRPKGHFAGALIQNAGLCGCRIGGAEVSMLHAGFIINRGGATCYDVLELIGHIKRVVFENSGVMLEPEIKLIGDFEERPCI